MIPRTASARKQYGASMLRPEISDPNIADPLVQPTSVD
jgi:hypothetical protein